MQWENEVLFEKPGGLWSCTFSEKLFKQLVGGSPGVFML